MKIGIASPVDINAFATSFDKRDGIILQRNCNPSTAPAINTLLLSFLKEGHQLRIFNLTKEDFVLKGDNIEIYGIKACSSYPVKYLWGDFINAKNIRTVIQENVVDLDVLHAHWTYAYAYAAMTFASQLPVFCTVRDWAAYIWKMESSKNKITWSFRYLMNEQVFRNEKIYFIANSPYTAARIKKKYGLKVPIIPNPIKQTFLSDKARIRPDKLKLLCISSSNDKRKNIETLLKAFRLLQTNYPNSHLSLIGKPFTRNSRKTTNWAQRGLLKNVSLLGPVNHDSITSYLDESSIFVTPSLEETFGNTLLEAMARKVPIVAGKDSGAIPYVLEHGKAGFLCNVSNAEELAGTLVHVYNNPKTAEEKVDYAFKYLVEHYLDLRVSQSHFKVYREKLNDKISP